MTRTVSFLFVLSIGISGFAYSQTTSTATKDSHAVTVVTNALNAMTTGILVNDLTLSTQVSRATSPTIVSGAATLEAASNGDASLTYSFADGQRGEIINTSAAPRGAWMSADGTWHPIVLHNTWTPAAWFAPTLVMEQALNDPEWAIGDLGAVAVGGLQLEHLRFWRVLPSASGTAATLGTIQNLSAVDAYFDMTTSLPVSLDFNLHPDSDPGTNIPVHVEYSNWQRSSGVLMPFHIQKFFNGGLMDDFTVSSAVVNSGLSVSVFNIPILSGGGQ